MVRPTIAELYLTEIRAVPGAGCRVPGWVPGFRVPGWCRVHIRSGFGSSVSGFGVRAFHRSFRIQSRWRKREPGTEPGTRNVPGPPEPNMEPGTWNLEPQRLLLKRPELKSVSGPPLGR